MTVPLRRGHRRKSTEGDPMTGSTALTRERADLIESLRRHRSFLLFTVRDLTDEQAMRRPTTSALARPG